MRKRIIAPGVDALTDEGSPHRQFAIVERKGLTVDRRLRTLTGQLIPSRARDQRILTIDSGDCAPPAVYVSVLASRTQHRRLRVAVSRSHPITTTGQPRPRRED